MGAAPGEHSMPQDTQSGKQPGADEGATGEGEAPSRRAPTDPAAGISPRTLPATGGQGVSNPQATELPSTRAEAGGPEAAGGSTAQLESMQAMEQWLRQIPDDPGGLLRRKFLLEHLRREGRSAEFRDP